MVFVDGMVGWRAGRARWVGLVAKRRIRGGLLASTFFFGVEEGGSSSPSSSSSSFFLFGVGFILRLRSHNISATQITDATSLTIKGKISSYSFHFQERQGIVVPQGMRRPAGNIALIQAISGRPLQISLSTL
jgi:hypothetical protein